MQHSTVLVFPSNHLTGTSKTEPDYNQVELTTQKPKQLLIKPQTYTTKPNETKTWFMPSSQENEWLYSAEG